MSLDVLYVTDAEALGGAELYLETLLRHACATGMRVGLALPTRPATAPLVDRARQMGAAVHPLEAVHRDGVSLGHLRRSLGLLERVRPSAVHLVLNGPRRCAEVALAAWLLRVPTRLATFQLVTPIPRFGGAAGWARAANRRAQFRTFTAGVAVSRGNAALLVGQYGFPTQRLHTIPNGVDTAAFAARTGGMRARWGVPEAAPLLGVVGRLGGQKGHALLLDALPTVWASFPEAHAVFVGQGELEPQLRAQADRLGAAGRVRFAGAVERAQVPQALAELDVFALPSLYEGLPFAVVEAMAAARAIVATEVDGTREALDHGRTGLLVPPGQPAPLAQAITRLLGDAALRQRLGAAAQAEAASRFDERAMLAATFALYRR
ncbi:glycosyltransferase family 4 protein [Chloroflexia bacterium SDU3-3]|nr:glycosyltransferase family 4 protein [Chloroflexia bacterium SDU3-3]